VTDPDLYFDLYDWRNAVASPAGPMSSSTRHVLLTLSLHMNPQGVAWPSQTTLAKRSGLSRRTVQASLDDAEKGAWIVRSWQGRNGQGWRRASYQGTIPAHIDLATKPWEMDSAWKRDAAIAAASAKRGATAAPPSPVTHGNVAQIVRNVAQPMPERGAESAQNVAQPMRTNSSSELLMELSISEGVLTHTASVNKFTGKKPESVTQPHPMAATLNGIDPFASAPEVSQEAKKPEPKPERDLKPDIRQLLENGQPPEAIQKILSGRGCTLEDVREAMT